MAVVITSSKKDLSTKYKIPLRATDDKAFGNRFAQLIIFNSVTNETYYNRRILPFSEVGGNYVYDLDIGPILEDAIGYLPFSYELTLPFTYDQPITVRIATNLPIPDENSYDARFYKVRDDYYKYWHDVSDSPSGVIFPTSGIYPDNLTCYKSPETSSALQIYSYVATETVEIIWFLKAGGQTNEDIAIAPSLAQAFKTQLNIGLDELLEASAVYTRADRDLFSSYNIKVDGGTIDHTVTIVDLEHCRLKPFSLTFVNKWGLWETFTVPAVSREILTPNKVLYRRVPSDVPNSIGTLGSAGTFPSQEVLTPVSEYDYIKSFRIQTDWLNQREMEQLKYALTSDILYGKIDLPDTSGQLHSHPIPVVATDTEVIMKQRRLDKVYNAIINLDTQPLNK